MRKKLVGENVALPFDEPLNSDGWWPDPVEHELPPPIVIDNATLRSFMWSATFPTHFPVFNHRKVQNLRIKPMRHEGKLFLCVGARFPPSHGPWAAPISASAYEMVPVELEPALRYRELGTYHGLRLLFEGVVYVLRGPVVTFTDGLVPHAPLT